MPSQTGFTWRGFLLSLLHIRPGEWRWRVSLEAAVVVGLPLLAFTQLGEPGLGLMCSLGAFTVIYFSARPRRERFIAQVPIAACLWLAAAAGVLTSGSALLTFITLIVIAVLACWFVLGLNIGPPGPIMFILVAGVSGHIAAPVSLGGSGVPAATVLSMVAIGCLTSLVIAAVPIFLSTRYRNQQPPASLATIYGRLSFDSARLRIMQRVILAVVLASVISQLLALPRGYWVILTCVAILQSHPDVSYTMARAVQRSLGTLLGIGVFWLLTGLQPQGLWLVLTVCVLQFGIELFITRNYALGLLFITPLALLITTTSSSVPATQVMGLRLLDTVIGSVIALAVLFGLEW